MQVQTAYLTHFYRCQSQEWMGIDRLRMDKFMMLTRKFVHTTWALMLGYASLCMQRARPANKQLRLCDWAGARRLTSGWPPSWQRC